MKNIFGIMILSVGFNLSVHAQQMVRYMATGPTFTVQEVGVIFAEKEGLMIADLIMPVETLPKGYKPHGIQKGDQLVMVNGSGIKTAKELEDFYAKAEVGSTIKLGFKRGDEKVLVTFAKANPNDLPKRKIVKKVIDSDGKEKEITDGE